MLLNIFRIFRKLHFFTIKSIRITSLILPMLLSGCVGMQNPAPVEHHDVYDLQAQNAKYNRIRSANYHINNTSKLNSNNQSVIQNTRSNATNITKTVDYNEVALNKKTLNEHPVYSNREQMKQHTEYLKHGYSDNHKIKVEGIDPVVLDKNKNAHSKIVQTVGKNYIVNTNKTGPSQQKVQGMNTRVPKTKPCVSAKPLSDNSQVNDKKKIDYNIPRNRNVSQAKKYVNYRSVTTKSTNTPSNNTHSISFNFFPKPIKGIVVNKFGDIVKGKKINGINVKSLKKQQVISSSQGIVIYSAQDLEFGNLIIVKSSNQLFFAYSYLSSRSVKEGDIITQGEEIGSIEQNKVIHIAMRKGKKSIDPLHYISYITDK